MSRIGNAPVALPAGVEVKFGNGQVTVKGKLGELKQDIAEGITVEIVDNEIVVKRAYESIFSKINLLRIINMDGINCGNLQNIVDKFVKSIKINDITFPLKLNNHLVDKFISLNKKSGPPAMMYS